MTPHPSSHFFTDWVPAQHFLLQAPKLYREGLGRGMRRRSTGPREFVISTMLQPRAPQIVPPPSLLLTGFWTIFLFFLPQGVKRPPGARSTDTGQRQTDGWADRTALRRVPIPVFPNSRSWLPNGFLLLGSHPSPLLRTLLTSAVLQHGLPISLRPVPFPRSLTPAGGHFPSKKPHPLRTSGKRGGGARGVGKREEQNLTPLREVPH